MKKLCNKEPCRGILITFLFLAIIVGLIYFLGKLNISRFDYERLVLYSILIIFGITMNAETYLYKRLKEEEIKLRKELDNLKKELKQKKE